MEDIEKEYGSSVYAQQLAEGFSYPRFKGELESEYRTTYNAQNAGRIRLSLIATMVIVAASIFVDYLTFPDGYGIKAALVSLFYMLPALGLSLWAVGQSRLIETLHWYIFGSTLSLGLAVSLIALLTDGHNYAVQALLLVLIFTYFVSSLLLHLAVISGLISIVVFMAVTLPFTESLEAIQCAFVLIAANFLGMVGCYSLECMNRAAFLRAGAAQELAGVDQLTGMPNRRRFLKHSEAIWAQAARDGSVIGIMMVDVDYFKRYNDAVGHLAGDKCLRRIGDSMLHAPKRTLDMVARFGGEEFIAIWFPGKPDAISDLVKRMHKRVNSTGVLHPDSDVANHVTASVGVSTSKPADNVDLKEAILLADRALYKAKEMGRNRIIHLDAQNPDDFREIASE